MGKAGGLESHKPHHRTCCQPCPRSRLQESSLIAAPRPSTRSLPTSPTAPCPFLAPLLLAQAPPAPPPLSLPAPPQAHCCWPRPPICPCPLPFCPLCPPQLPQPLTAVGLIEGADGALPVVQGGVAVQARMGHELQAAIRPRDLGGGERVGLGLGVFGVCVGVWGGRKGGDGGDQEGKVAEHRSARDE